MGTWPIYKKHFLQLILTKKLSFDKISPSDFYFFPFFSICTCVPFTLFIRLINCRDFIQIWYDNKMLSSQWDNDNQHFVYIIVSWFLLGIITCQGFLFPCSCMNRCTCSTVSLSRWFPLSTWHSQLHLDVSAYQFLRLAAPGNTECWERHLAGEIGSTGVRLVSSDHGLFHDRRRALVLINPYISLIGSLETKPKEKQNNFQKMKRI